MVEKVQYTEDNIRSLDWKEHIRMRPGMYIGKLGDGSSPDDGIYILIKEVLDNCIDEFVMGAGKTIEIKIIDNQVIVRDYGRGIPLGKVVDVVLKWILGKYDSRALRNRWSKGSGNQGGERTFFLCGRIGSWRTSQKSNFWVWCFDWRRRTTTF